MDFLFNLAIIIVDQSMLFIINILVARHVGETLFGDFSVAINALLLLSTIVTLGIDSIVAYYFPKLYVKKQFTQMAQLGRSIRGFLQPLHLSLFSLGLLFSLTIIALSIAFKNLTLFEMNHPLFLFLWGTSAISLYNIFVQLFRSIGYMRTGVLLSLVQTVFYFILAVLVYQNFHSFVSKNYLMFFPHAMIIAFLASYFLTDLIGLGVFGYITRPFQARLKKRPTQAPYEWHRKIYGYMVQNLNIYVFTTIPLLAMEWLAHDEKAVGLFAAVTSIISLALIGIRPLGVLIAPEISAALAGSKQELYQTMRHTLSICFAMAAIVTLIFTLCGKQILLLYQAKFISALPYLYYSLVNIIVYSINMPLSRMVQYSKYGDKLGAKLTLLFISLQIATSILSIKLYGLMGAIGCYVGINLCYFIAMLTIATKIYRHHGENASKTALE